MMQIPAPDFNLEATLESGQVFGFKRTGDVFTGSIARKPLTLSLRDEKLDVSGNISPEDIKKYFDLSRNLDEIYQFIETDKALAPLRDLKGLRLIHQDTWEAFACFIISQNNNVKRIQGIWNRLSDNFSDQPGTFPLPGPIAESSEDTLRALGLGYRARYLFEAAKQVHAKPSYLNDIRDMDTPIARERLMECLGVGQKVADCVLLFGFQKFDVFPADVWILRIMRSLYFKGKKVSEADIQNLAQKKWGAMKGYLQQYLFHGARMGLIS